MSGADRPRGRWLLAGAALWLAAALLIPLLGERILLGVRGRPVASAAGRSAIPGFLLMLSAGSACIATLLASAAFLARSGEPGPAAPAPARGPRGPLVAAFLVSAAIGGLLVHAAGRSFLYDEILEMKHEVKTPLLEGLRPRSFINHLSGTLAARAGVALFGDSERAARAGTVLITVLGLAGASLAANRLAPGALATLWPPLLLGIQGVVLNLSIQIRGYSPLMWGGLGLGALVAVALSSPGPPGRLRTAGLAGCALLMAFAHFFGFLYLGVLTAGLHLYLWTGWGLLGPPLPPEDRPRRRAELSTTAGLLAAILGASFCFWAHDLPWLLFRSGGAPTAVKPPRTGTVHRRLLSELAFLQSESGLPGWVLLPLVLVAVAALLVAWRGAPALRLAALTAILPVALVLATTFVKPVYLFSRYFAASLPLGALVLSVGVGGMVGRLRRPALPTVLILVVTAVASWPGLIGFLGDVHGYREGVAEGVRWLTRHGDSRSRLVPVGGREAREVVSYYLPPGMTLDLNDAGPLAERQRDGILDLFVALGKDRLRGWRAAGLEPSTTVLPLRATGYRQSPLVLVATQRVAVP